MITQEQVQAIVRLAPDAQFNIVDGVLVWHSGEISVDAIEAEVQWFKNRKAGYATISDQLDVLFHDIEAGMFGKLAKTSDFYTGIVAVKDSTPKST